MTTKQRFIEMYKRLPDKARTELVYHFAGKPMTLNVVYLEVINNTRMSKVILKDLGFIND